MKTSGDLGSNPSRAIITMTIKSIKEEIERLSSFAKAFLVVLILILIFLIFAMVSANIKINSLSARLSSSVDQLDQRINETRNDFKQNDNILQQNLNYKIDLVAESLNQTKKESYQQIKSLSGELQSSQQQISTLEDRLKNIKVSSSDFSSIVRDVVKSVVSIKTDKGEGSGFIVDSAGYVVTNYHVIEGVTSAGIYTYDGRMYPVKRIGYDPDIDIAILKIITTDSFDALSFGDSSRISVGERVIAVGNPAGFDFSVTEGIVSSAKRVGNNGVTYIQIDVPINPGNSGGPLIDANADVIGINTLKISGLEGVGFAIASNEVDNMIMNTIETDKNKIS